MTFKGTANNVVPFFLHKKMRGYNYVKRNKCMY